MKLVHWQLVSGLLHLVQRGGDWAGPLAVPNVTACVSTASVWLTVLLNNGPLLCGFNGFIKGSIAFSGASSSYSLTANRRVRRCCRKWYVECGAPPRLRLLCRVTGADWVIDEVPRLLAGRRQTAGRLGLTASSRGAPRPVPWSITGRPCLGRSPVEAANSISAPRWRSAAMPPSRRRCLPPYVPQVRSQSVRRK